MQFEPYKKEYFKACIGLFNGNVGHFFAEWERDYFVNFLESYASEHPYFVVIINGELVACGGYEKEDESVTLSWGMVKRDLHGQGIGRKLFNYRLSRITKEYHGLSMQIDTSQHTKKFYEKCGFVAYKIEKDGYDLGLDKVYMRYSVLGLNNTHL